MDKLEIATRIIIREMARINGLHLSDKDLDEIVDGEDAFDMSFAIMRFHAILLNPFVISCCDGHRLFFSERFVSWVKELR